MKIPDEIRQQLRIQRPTLLVDRHKVLRNIKRLHNKIKTSGVRFRPHFKTHQSPDIANWFREQGIDCATVSSLDMAMYFANAGWRDLTVAFPLNLLEIEKAAYLASQMELHLVVDSLRPLEALQQHLQTQYPQTSVGVWIKIDLGTHRAGVSWQDRPFLLALAKAIHSDSKLIFRGILAHAGHSYDCTSRQALQQVHYDTLVKLQGLRDMLEAHGYRPCLISVGDTPTASLVEDFTGVDELRPGNFVFYDLMQLQLGTCEPSDLALGVACPVVGVHPDRQQVLLYGGAVHFSKDFEVQGGQTCYGRVAQFAKTTWDLRETPPTLTELSQEHGIVQFPPAADMPLEVGDVVVVLPVHSCLTADLYSSYKTLEGHDLYRRHSNDLESPAEITR